MNSSYQLKSLVLPVALMASLLVILIPLPTVVMDVLLAVNIASAVLILLTTVFVRTPLEFNIFPTVLLTATLGRLVVNVATTRLILTNAGNNGLSAAGGIVEGFGGFVAGNQLIVGLVIFSIIVLIQFLVVTKGATRISEVAARFALDGMSGRQMAIDADLNAGLIDRKQAQTLRGELTRQADFYGAMDGASKFVRGDAIAGIVITLVNIVGGLFIGVTSYGMSITEAANVFSRLTIGDGLVSQIPAFLISVAAGLLITRSTERVNLPVEFLRQLFKRPEPLFVAAAFLGILIFTRLPAVPLLVVAGGLVGMAYMLTRSSNWLDDEEAEEQPAETRPKQERRVEDLLAVDPVELELGAGLLRLVDKQRGGDLLERITMLRQLVASEMGVVLPRVRIRDNLQLEDYAYRFKIFENPVATGRAFPLRVLATETQQVAERIDGVAAVDPTNDQTAAWIDPAIGELARERGYTLTGAVDVVVGHLQRVVRRHAAELLTRDATQLLLDQVAESSPTIVAELIPERLSLGQVQKVLRGLLKERVSIRNLPLILETLSDNSVSTSDTAAQVELVRRQLSRTISGTFRDKAGELHVVTLDSAWESRLQSVDMESPLPADERKELMDEVRIALSSLQRNRPAVLLVNSALRSTLARLTTGTNPEVSVLSYSEITEDTQLRSVGTVGRRQTAA
ncbi:MAG: flagellar biosynthesis protein FlhA [Planctomycetota bacterium]